MGNFDESESPDDWQYFLNCMSSKAVLSGDVIRVKQCSFLKEKVEICYSSDYIYNGLKQWLNQCLRRPTVAKSASVAEKFRLKGNNYVGNNDKVSALNCYNKSIFYAPKDSDELRSAYGNRSFLLMEMKHYLECVQDVDRALIGNHLSLRKIKLLMRKGQALIALAKYPEALQTLEKASSMGRNFDDELEKKAQKILSEINLLIIQIKTDYKGNSCLTPLENILTVLKDPNLNFIKNNDFRSASKTISLMSNETKGRYVIANKNIEVGEILFAERPFAFVVLPEMADRYCSYCCKTAYFPIPCENCPLACFCNETCRSLAEKNFHKWECGGLEICYSIGIVHLALRVALLGLLEQNIEKYKEVTNLVSHINESNAIDLFNYAITSTLLTVYLEEYTDLFKGPQRKEKLFDFGGNLLLHIAQLICNGHAITDIESECDSNLSLLIENQVRVATAIYPSASMMNHSCDPSIINSFFESLLIVRASKDLKKGEEVYNCYGPMVQKMNYEERQELLLTQYKFVCDCISCKKKAGPILDSIICESCSTVLSFGQQSCTSCLKSVNIQLVKSDLDSANAYYKDGLNLMNSGKFLESCDYFKKSLSLYRKRYHKNHQKILECRDSLARVYANIGQEEEAYSCIIQNIQFIEDIYGKTAVEVGQEILKLLTVATNLVNKNKLKSKSNRKILERCIQLGKRGKFILELSYGDWHPRYKDFCKHLEYLSLCINI